MAVTPTYAYKHTRVPYFIYIVCLLHVAAAHVAILSECITKDILLHKCILHLYNGSARTVSSALMPQFLRDLALYKIT